MRPGPWSFFFAALNFVDVVVFFSGAKIVKTYEVCNSLTKELWIFFP